MSSDKAFMYKVHDNEPALKDALEYAIWSAEREVDDAYRIWTRYVRVAATGCEDDGEVIANDSLGIMAELGADAQQDYLRAKRVWEMLCHVQIVHNNSTR